MNGVLEGFADAFGTSTGLSVVPFLSGTVVRAIGKWNTTSHSKTAEDTTSLEVVFELGYWPYYGTYAEQVAHRLDPITWVEIGRLSGEPGDEVFESAVNVHFMPPYGWYQGDD
jgi:hypothetical protein